MAWDIKVGDRVRLTVPVSECEVGSGTVRKIWDNDVVSIEMDSGHWNPVPLEHVRKIEETARGGSRAFERRED